MKKTDPLYVCCWCNRVAFGRRCAVTFSLDKSIKKPEKSFGVMVELDDGKLFRAVFLGMDAPFDSDMDVALVCCSSKCAESLEQRMLKDSNIFGILYGLRIEGGLR